MPPVYISFSAELYPQTIEPLLAAVLHHASKPETTGITLLFSTPGGSVSSAMHTYNVLRGLPVPLTIHNVGDIQSIGLPIFLASRMRYGCKYSSFSFHRVTYEFRQATQADEHILKQNLGTVASDRRRIVSLISENTKLPPVEVGRLMDDAATVDGDFALSHGLIHEVREVDMAPGAVALHLAFKRPTD